MNGTEPGSGAPRASVVVLTRNRRDSLGRTLRAVSRLDHPSYEVVVVDNASTDGTRDVVADSGARYVFSMASNGISRSRQIGIEVARGDIVAMCDDDCVPEPDWLARLDQRLDRERDLGLVGGKVVNVGFPGRRRFKGTSRLVGPNGILSFVEDAADAEYFGNLNLAVRKEAVKTVGGYDPFLKAGREEIDLAASLRRRGYRTGFEPSAVVTHHFTKINYKRGRLLYDRHLMRLYFHFKHFPPSTAAAWGRFLRDEARLLARDALRAARFSGAVLLRGRMGRLPSAAIEWLNLTAARALIPWVFARARASSARLDSGTATNPGHRRPA